MCALALLALAGCGKKAPLRPPGSQPPAAEAR
jgi:predicted small lipoprotein YifL